MKMVKISKDVSESFGYKQFFIIKYSKVKKEKPCSMWFCKNKLKPNKNYLSFGFGVMPFKINRGKKVFCCKKCFKKELTSNPPKFRDFKYWFLQQEFIK